ncbi:MAG: response regulator transcription factor [Bacteroidetes bacterium]|nr:response regulator transcription factor [Bacteroidota bacterium]
MIKTLIVEDEQKSRDMLADIIRKSFSELNIVGLAKNVKEGVEIINTQNPDLVFLDISMPDGSGFDLLEAVSNHQFEVVFVTASDQHAIRAIKYSACDYLLKPLDIEELRAAVEKVVKKKNAAPNMENLQFLVQHLKRSDEHFQKITLPTGAAFEVVNVKDIIRCEADGSYTSFYLTDKRKLLISLGLKHYEELLADADFIRVHHHHLINMNHVVRYIKEDGGTAIMSDGSNIEISRRKKDTFLEKLNKH